MDTLVAGLKYVKALLDSKAFKSKGIEHKPIPQCNNFKTYSTEYYRCVCEYYIFTVWHPVGTCKMGPKTDKTAVVDSKLKVHGVKNLRIIDASIMPTMVSGNTNAPVVMIGERGVDFLLKDYQPKPKSGKDKSEL